MGFMYGVDMKGGSMDLYGEFIETIKNRLSEELGIKKDEIIFYEEGTSPIDDRTKQLFKDINLRYCGDEDEQDLMLDMLIFKADIEDGAEENVMRLAIGRCFEDYEEACYNDETGESAQKIIDNIIEEEKQQLEDLKKVNISPDIYKNRASNNYNAIKKDLIIRPLNYRIHGNDLSVSVYKRVGEVALVLYQRMGENEGILTTSKIRSDEIKDWGMAGKEDEIMQEALKNTCSIYPPIVYNYRENREVRLLEEDNVAREDIVSPFGDGGILLSTTNTTNGAISIFYPGVIDKMIKIMHGPFDAVFMNINDVMITPSGSKAAGYYAANAIKDSKLGEPLSGKIYRCDKKGIRLK